MWVENLFCFYLFRHTETRTMLHFVTARCALQPPTLLHHNVYPLEAAHYHGHPNAHVRHVRWTTCSLSFSDFSFFLFFIFLAEGRVQSAPVPQHSSTHLVASLLAYVGFALVLAYYTDAVVTQKVSGCVNPLHFSFSQQSVLLIIFALFCAYWPLYWFVFLLFSSTHYNFVLWDEILSVSIPRLILCPFLKNKTTLQLRQCIDWSFHIVCIVWSFGVPVGEGRGRGGTDRRRHGAHPRGAIPLARVEKLWRWCRR
jgi:hypothetical protein